VYQFKYADGAQQALAAIQNSLKHVQVSLADLAEYRNGRVEEFQDRGTGGYDASKVRTGYQDRGGGGRGRGRGRDTYRDSYRDSYRGDDRPYDNSRRYDDRRYDTRRNDDTARRPYNNRDDRNDYKPYNRHGQFCPLPSFPLDADVGGGVCVDNNSSGRNDNSEVDVDYNYQGGDDKDNQQSTPRVERSVVDHWKDPDDDDNAGGNYEQHHRRSRWGEDDDGGDSDR
jgi:hypothetical protein